MRILRNTGGGHKAAHRTVTPARSRSLDRPGASDASFEVRAGDALRLAFVLWNGDIGGAETLSVALAHALRASGNDARVVVLETADPLAARLAEARVPFACRPPPREAICTDGRCERRGRSRPRVRRVPGARPSPWRLYRTCCGRRARGRAANESNAASCAATPSSRSPDGHARRRRARRRIGLLVPPD